MSGHQMGPPLPSLKQDLPTALTCCFLLAPSLAALLERALLVLHLKLWHWIYSDLQVDLSYPPDARSQQLRAFSISGISNSQPDEHRFCLSLLGVQIILSAQPLRRSGQPLSGCPWCSAVCWPPPMVLLPGNRAPLPGHSSCGQEGHLPLPQQDWSLWIVSYILPGVKRLCNMSTCPGVSSRIQLHDSDRVPVL